MKMPRHLLDVTLVSDDLVGILPVKIPIYHYVTLVSDDLVGILPMKIPIYQYVTFVSDSDELLRRRR